MKNKRLLSIILLSLSFCFVSGAGYGEIPEWMTKPSTVTYIEVELLDAMIEFIMSNPETFIYAKCIYDGGQLIERFPSGVSTRGKVFVKIADIREGFFYKSGPALLDEFKKTLKSVYSYINHIATDMDEDIVAKFETREGVPLGYFYQGEYHLWEE